MTPLPPVPEVLRVTLNWDVGSDADVSTVLHFLYSGTRPSSDTLTTMAQSAVEVVEAEAPAGMVSANSFTGLSLIDLTDSSGGEGVRVVDAPGTRTGAPIPGSASVVANYQIARRYRGGKPKSFLPFGTDADLASEQTWSTSAVADFTTVMNNILNAFPGVSASGTTIDGQVNVSYYTGNLVVTSPTTGRARNVPQKRATPLVDPMLSATVSNKIGSQRRRLRASV